MTAAAQLVMRFVAAGQRLPEPSRRAAALAGAIER